MGGTLIPLFVVFSFAMQFHMLTGPGTSILRGMGRVYDEFTYSVPNLLLLAVTLPATRWIEGRWTALGIGLAVAVATAVSACVLMGRVLFSAESAIGTLPAGSDRARIGRPMWLPVSWHGPFPMVAAVTRWQGAAVLVTVGAVYVAAVLAMLLRWILTDAEKQKSRGMMHRGWRILHGPEVTA